MALLINVDFLSEWLRSFEISMLTNQTRNDLLATDMQNCPSAFMAFNLGFELKSHNLDEDVFRLQSGILNSIMWRKHLCIW